MNKQNLLLLIFIWGGFFSVQLYGENLSIGCKKFKYPPKMDGNPEEWKDLPYINLVPNQKHVVVGSDKWNGLKDLSGKAFLGWDKNNFYIALIVTDDIINQTIRGKNLWQGDHVELFIDADIEKDKKTNSFNEDDFQIGLSPGNFAGTGDFLLDLNPEAVVWVPKSKSSKNSKIKIASARTKSGYIIEVAIPFSILEIKPADGLEIKIDICLSDTDKFDAIQETLTSLSAKEWGLRDLSRQKYVVFKL